MDLDLGYPQEKQFLFLRDKHRYVGYGGARGGGKSWSVRYKAVRLALEHPGIDILIVRRTLEELRNNHIKPLRATLNGIATYNKTEKVFTFPKQPGAPLGSTINLGYCDNDGDAEQYQGAEHDVVFLEEATNLKEDWIKKIDLTVRGNAKYPKRTYFTCNPGGVSHDYIKRLFVDKEYQEDEDPNDYSFISALVTDNTYLMENQPGYYNMLKNLPSKLRAAWLEGRWDVYEGQFFEDFRTTPDVEQCVAHGIEPDVARQRHLWTHVIPAFDLNVGEAKSWVIYRSYDFGYSKPFSCAWSAIDYDGTMYRILELYGCTGEPDEGVKWTPDEQARKIREIETTHPWLQGRQIFGVADPAIWDTSRGESIAETMNRHGVSFTPGDHERIPGWMQCHYRLQFDQNGRARFYVFDNCKHFIRTIPQLMYSETHNEDLDTSMEDHIADEWRYLCMARPITPIRAIPETVHLFDPLNQFKKRGD